MKNPHIDLSYTFLLICIYPEDRYNILIQNWLPDILHEQQVHLKRDRVIPLFKA